MRVFVTGASGHIGFPVVAELLGAGHKVAGLARSEASAEKLRKAGAEVVRGDLDDLAGLVAAAKAAAGVIHLGYTHALAFGGLVRLLAGIDLPGHALPALVRWEVALLGELGFGLDFSGPAGDNDRLAYVSPRTGRAVTLSQAGAWVDRLFPLPAFMLDDSEPGLADCLAGLRITQHFFARDVFGARHLPLPAARTRLYELISDRFN